VRYVRVLGVLLAAIFAMSATTVVVASPAFAGGCNKECKQAKAAEKQVATEEQGLAKLAKQSQKAKVESVWTKFDQCPVDYPELWPENGEKYEGCIYGEAGPESFFQAGKVTVHFVHPVLLRGAEEENEFTGELKYLPALNGETIAKVAEPAPSLTEGVNAELLPEPEKARYEKYIAKGEKKTTVTAVIELAKPATDIGLNEAHLLAEEGTAFDFPVEIHLVNKFLGPYCYVGSYSHPIEVPFTTGATNPEPPNTPIHGQLGEIKVIGEGNILQVGSSTKQTILANNEYASPGVQGCGVEGKADAALDSALGLPSPAGSNSTELVGALFQAGYNATEEHLHT
jgi:hypothetical protein